MRVYHQRQDWLAELHLRLLAQEWTNLRCDTNELLMPVQTQTHTAHKPQTILKDLER